MHLPGPPPRYAIASNGGHLLVDGVPDPDWTAAGRGAARRRAPRWPRSQAHLQAPAGGRFVLERCARRATCSPTPSSTAPRCPTGWVDELAAWCAPRGWAVSLQGRKVYAVPRPLTKSAAAARSRAGSAAAPLLAAGDSLLDADLLDVADAAIRPAHGELADSGFTRRPPRGHPPPTGVRAGRSGWLAWTAPPASGSL